MENEEIIDGQEIDYKALYEETNDKLVEKDTKVGELEGLIQKHKDKKPAKVEKTEAPTFGKEEVAKMLTENEFYKNNPDMSEYKEQIDKYTSNGNISIEQAKLLVLQGDPTIENRKNTQNANITDGASGGGTKTYSQEDLYNLGQKNPALKKQAMQDIASGKAIETA